MHDTVIQDLAKNLYSNDTQRLKELDMIKLQNETYRQHKRDSHKQVQESYSQPPLKIQLNKKQRRFMKKSKMNLNMVILMKKVYLEMYQPLLNQHHYLIKLEKNLKRNECIKQIQEILLTSKSLYFDVASTLLHQYGNLDMAEDKLAFINDLKLSLVNQTLLTNINQQNFSVIIAIVLRLCIDKKYQFSNYTTPATQSEIYKSSLGCNDNQLTKSLQYIFDVLLHSKETEQVLICLVHVFNDHLLMDFTNEISKNEKMMLRLKLKCIERSIQNSKNYRYLVFQLKYLNFLNAIHLKIQLQYKYQQYIIGRITFNQRT